uniref:OXA-198 family carbapenem-hydrolyzing class D beta-lactamase OXA-1186 n=1 Tax=Citrobacter freundii TaxID=546 RepID=UPI0024300A09|nr:OXA-198 family carbapenem-hydrolyzing class D beta-lactamase OXA-1186 [Citrobacter freundii]WEG43791.1 OXA-198 family carbapenem-hydrolyzing class D beta-lactamase OXA-1186 [Citrobacter freundii]
MSKFFITFLVFLWPLSAVAEDQVLAGLFSQHGMKGTIVISSLHNEKTFIYNEPRANLKFSTASTFKILNTLISLEEKAISGKDDVLKWDGHIYDFPDWNHDQTLESAFKVSCVWCFQELARRVGAEKYRNYLRESAYGELREPFMETTFWLDGSLQISAIEQVDFLKKVYLRTLPFNATSYETLRQIMLVEKTPAYTMWAKTGWAARVKPQVGWYVGYVETPKDVWFFATNIETRDEKDLPLRQKLTRAALQAKGVIE